MHMTAVFLLLLVNNCIGENIDTVSSEYSSSSKTGAGSLFEKEKSDSEVELVEPVQYDKDYNIIIRVLIKTGNESKIIDSSADRVELVLNATANDTVIEAEVCRFMSEILKIKEEYISILEKEDEDDKMKKILQVDGSVIGGAMVLDRIINAIQDETFIKLIKEEEAQLSRSRQLLDS